jgi:hypothetical protein
MYFLLFWPKTFTVPSTLQTAQVLFRADMKRSNFLGGLSMKCVKKVRQNSSVWRTGWMTVELGFDSRQWKEFPLHLNSIQISIGAHPASYPMGTKCPLPEDQITYRISKKNTWKTTIGRQRRRREHNIKVDLSEKDCKDWVG